MGAFEQHAERALGVVFRLHGADATYEPEAGAPVAGIRVVVNKADDLAEIGVASFVAAKRLVEVRVSDVAEPTKNGVFVVGSARYVITAKPKIEDPDGLVWTCLCDPE